MALSCRKAKSQHLTHGLTRSSFAPAYLQVSADYGIMPYIQLETNAKRLERVSSFYDVRLGPCEPKVKAIAVNGSGSESGPLEVSLEATKFCSPDWSFHLVAMTYRGTKARNYTGVLPPEPTGKGVRDLGACKQSQNNGTNLNSAEVRQLHVSSVFMPGTYGSPH